MVNILYNKKSKKPKEYEDINSRYNGIALSGFDIVSSQFSMHYYFKDKITFNGFIENLRNNVKHNGYFIGTCYNGENIFNYFEERKKLSNKENQIFLFDSSKNKIIHYINDFFIYNLNLTSVLNLIQSQFNNAK